MSTERPPNIPRQLPPPLVTGSFTLSATQAGVTLEGGAAGISVAIDAELIGGVVNFIERHAHEPSAPVADDDDDGLWIGDEEHDGAEVLIVRNPMAGGITISDMKKFREHTTPGIEIDGCDLLKVTTLLCTFGGYDVPVSVAALPIEESPTLKTPRGLVIEARGGKRRDVLLRNTPFGPMVRMSPRSVADLISFIDSDATEYSTGRPFKFVADSNGITIRHRLFNDPLAVRVYADEREEVATFLRTHMKSEV